MFIVTIKQGTGNFNFLFEILMLRPKKDTSKRNMFYFFQLKLWRIYFMKTEAATRGVL